MLGFPIRKSSDLSSFDSSPRLIAAYYVLHRLLVPRHPPYALKHLLTKMLASTVQFSNNTQVQIPTRHQHPPKRAGMTEDSILSFVDIQKGHSRVLSGPNSVSVYSPRSQRCRDHDAMKTVSVPPMSVRRMTYASETVSDTPSFDCSKSSCRSAP